jgi:hypothetical protein
MSKELVSDELWQIVEPLLPIEPPKARAVAFGSACLSNHATCCVDCFGYRNAELPSAPVLTHDDRSAEYEFPRRPLLGSSVNKTRGRKGRSP